MPASSSCRQDADGLAALEALRIGVRGFVRSPDELMGLGDVVARVARGDRGDAAGSSRRGRGGARTPRAAGAGRRGRRRGAHAAGAAGAVAACRRPHARARSGADSRISPRTVEGHASGVYRKLDVRTRGPGGGPSRVDGSRRRPLTRLSVARNPADRSTMAGRRPRSRSSIRLGRRCHRRAAVGRPSRPRHARGCLARMQGARGGGRSERRPRSGGEDEAASSHRPREPCRAG